MSGLTFPPDEVDQLVGLAETYRAARLAECDSKAAVYRAAQALEARELEAAACSEKAKAAWVALRGFLDRGEP